MPHDVMPSTKGWERGGGKGDICYLRRLSSGEAATHTEGWLPGKWPDVAR